MKNLLVVFSILSLSMFSFVSKESSVLEVGLHSGKISFFSEAFAAEAPAQIAIPSDQDPAILILNLLTNWKALSGYAIASILSMLAGLMVRAYVQNKWKYKRLTMALISLIFGYAQQMAAGGVSTATVLISTLVTYGAAKYIYDELRDAGIIKLYDFKA